MDMWTIGSILTWTKQYFSEKGMDTPRLDAEVLLSHILGKDRLYLYVHFDQPLEKYELAAFREAVKKRVLHTPVAYIIGHKEFMGIDFFVSSDVLIPRPDTEVLVETVIDTIKDKDKLQILDIGTGSGAIIISILKALPQAIGYGVDISPGALKVAQKNADKHNVLSRLFFKESNIYSALSGKTFDVIVSNPPYIPKDDIQRLSPEVHKEPYSALAGGKDGLDFYRRIIDGAPQFLNSGGMLAFEVGINQASDVAGLAKQAGCFAVEKIVKDYGGIERVVVLKLLED